MKTIILILVPFFLALFPVFAFSGSCPLISEIKKDQHVHVVFKETPKGHIKGKVISCDKVNCILVISTSSDYRKYYIDVSSVAALGTK